MTYKPRRLRREREGSRPFWHLIVKDPQLTREQAEQIRAAFTKARRQGLVVTSDRIELRRMR